jgi:hypothetical protein
MREGMILCPVNGNDGAPLGDVLDWVGRRLLSRFHGMTVDDVQGYWDTGNGTQVEDVRRFTVAYDAKDLEGDVTLTAIARQYGYEAKQDAVYVRYASGDVVILQTRHLWDRDMSKPESLVALAA